MTVDKIIRVLSNDCEMVRDTVKYTNFKKNDIEITIDKSGFYPRLSLCDTSKETECLKDKSNVWLPLEIVSKFVVTYDRIYMDTYSGCHFEIIYRFDM